MQAACSPDGARVVTGDQAGASIIWDALSGKSIHKMPGHRSGISAIAFNSDGTRVATGSMDGMIKLWDSSSGKIIHELNDHNTQIYNIIFTPDGSQVITASQAGVTKIWNTQTGQLIDSLESRGARFFAITFSRDRTRFLTSSEKDLIIFDALSFQILHKWNPGKTSDAAFSPDGTLVATAGKDGKARIWRIGYTAKELKRRLSEKAVIPLPGDERSAEETFRFLWDNERTGAGR